MNLKSTKGQSVHEKELLVNDSLLTLAAYLAGRDHRPRREHMLQIIRCGPQATHYCAVLCRRAEMRPACSP